tara:strand:- start:3239 stop:4618 length:1380 start_codon:yes stop_codon:yes gene_type:complete
MLSVFDLFSIGVGPSSSHTVGPMKAAHSFIVYLHTHNHLKDVTQVQVELFGSLAQTGKGHGTDKAIYLGLAGELPETVEPEQISTIIQSIKDQQGFTAHGHFIAFTRQSGFTFHYQKRLAFHVNGMCFSALKKDNTWIKKEYYSIGGGFIVDDTQVKQNQKSSAANKAEKIKIPYPYESAKALMKICQQEKISIYEVVLHNELCLRSKDEIAQQLWHIWQTMKACIERGCHQKGTLPGGLKVKRRAPELYRSIQASPESKQGLNALDWVNMFAIAVNEENAAGGRVVTAPTNGAAGIIPAVMAYIDEFIKPLEQTSCLRYLLTCAAIGFLYKRNASISGAEVGCQGEVGVACSMAAAGLTEILGGTTEQIENAAEIGMEHNLGLTCDPVGGLVQIPCIERNAIASVKAINAAQLALNGDGQHKVSLDRVIRTMWETGQDMQTKYKETAQGGLAVNIIEC